jgi:hypothetical protein
MKTVRDACKLQSNALSINVGDQIEQLDQLIFGTNAHDYFAKTFITDGMRQLLSKGMARLAGKSNDAIFHLKQAMGGGKTHLIVGFGLLAKDISIRRILISEIPYNQDFTSAKIAAFNGRNNPPSYMWGEIAQQLGKESLFREFWEFGVKAPDEMAWIKLFEGNEPILILLDEMPPYFHYYSTQPLGQGTVADVVTRAFANMLIAAQKRSNVCVVVSDLEAAYSTGGKLIQKALDDANQELGRAEISITPVNLESNEIYKILRKRLFESIPSHSEIQDIAENYGKKLSEAAKAKTLERSAESITDEIIETYPFHPRFKNLVALFKANEKFKQTRGLMELVSRLLKSVWERSDNDVFLIGAQHFNLEISDVREKLTEISEMRDVIARDLWSSNRDSHAQLIDLNSGKDTAIQVGALLLTASLSTAVNSVKGLTEAEILECLINPLREPNDYRAALNEMLKVAWYMHRTQEGRYYFDRQENLTKKLQGYADKAPENKVDELIRERLSEMYAPKTKEAYEKVLPLPSMDDAEAALKVGRALLLVSPDGKTPPEMVTKFFENLVNKNNLLVLTGDKSQIASLEKAARHVYAVMKANAEIKETHPQRKEIEEKSTQYTQDFQTTVISVFDKVLFPGVQSGQPLLRSKALDGTYPSNEPYNGEQQVIKTLTSDPLKLYLDVKKNFDTLRARAESLLFGNQDEVRRTDFIDKFRQQPAMPWVPSKGLDLLIQEAFQRGFWEDLGNGYITKKPKPKLTSCLVSEQGEADDDGNVRLKVEPINAGPAPRIHYAENAAVAETSPTLNENILNTKALKVQFLVIDPTGKYSIGPAITWKHKLVIRNRFDVTLRTVELLVAPCGTIRYTLDGSEARNGLKYSAPIDIGDEETRIWVYAEAEDLETRIVFTFPAKGEKGVKIRPDLPAEIMTNKPKRLDSSTKTYAGLKEAKEKGIEFEQVSLQLGQSPKTIMLAMGEVRVKALFIEELLLKLQPVVPADAPVVLSFRKAYFATGHDLEQFAKAAGIELETDEVTQ